MVKLHPRALRAGLRKRLRRLRQDPRTVWYAKALAIRLSRLRADARVWPRRRTRGIDLIGYLRGSLGLGESARILARALETSEVEHSFVAIPTPLGRDTLDAGVPLTSGFPHAVTVLHVNPTEVEGFARAFGEDAFGGRKLVGLWYWELEEIPLEWRAMSLVFDEVWVASEWLRGALAPQLHCPVHAFPFPLDAIGTPPPPADGELALAIPEDRYVFLTLFDHHSGFERKNPEGTLRAYLDAFPSDTGRTALVLKSQNARIAPEKQQRLVSAAAGRTDIFLLDADLPKTAMDALFHRADCFVSLHRSEGLGLGFLMAARSGKKALVTGYSAPAEFGDLPNVELLPYRRVPVATDHDAYRGRGEWAEPDLAGAAQRMRELAARGRAVSAGAVTPPAAGIPARHRSAAFLAFVEARLDELTGRGHARSPRVAWWWGSR